MGAKIYLPAPRVGDFFQQNRERLKKEMVIVAENTDTKYTVLLTDDCDLPQFLVCREEEPEYKEWANIASCGDVAFKIYLRYLFPVTVSIDAGEGCENGPPPFESEDCDEELTRQEMDDLQYEREDELMLALADFLAVVLQEGDGDGTMIIEEYGQSFMEDALDSILRSVSSDLLMPVYRPMFIVDEETGVETYTEFPYDTE